MSYIQNMPDGPSIVIGAVQKEFDIWFKGKATSLLLPGFNGAPGFGALLAGMLMAKNLSAGGRKGLMVPYCPSDYTGVGTDNRIMAGRTWLTSGGVTTESTVQCTIDDSYRFVVGDDLIIGDDTTPPEDLGAITDIDRTSNPALATITVTTAIGGTSFMVANMANVHVKCGLATPFMDVVGILTATMASGIGPVASGSMPTTILVPGNQALLASEFRNYDTAAMAVLGARIVNSYVVL